jgi:hypothetical protein
MECWRTEWLSGATPALGIAVGDADQDVLTIDTYLGKGASVLFLCDTGVVPAINDFLFRSAPGVVSNTGITGQQFARALGVRLDGRMTRSRRAFARMDAAHAPCAFKRNGEARLPVNGCGGRSKRASASRR